MRWIEDLRNRFDFAVRQRLRIGRHVTEPLPTDVAWQAEARGFLRTLDWTRIAPKRSALDVGARTFALAPVLAELCGEEAVITGVELDAYRRFADFTTRKDHAEYWARSVKHGKFFAGDVRRIEEMHDVVLLLDPFVSEDPLLAWGLPLRELAPAAIVKHCCGLARTALVVSNPSEDEAAITDALVRENGLRQTQRAEWPRRILRVFAREAKVAASAGCAGM